eukprot:TRINITY_DN1404_c0_g1_i2.p1 TRINITY_DN1404_c0_g1~~TRINITY_DN1404_c0_g1_i2.p1  ORF type:complete len:492 (+),score=46.17 TRINITY_DN1404_c0_g1_i2:82-1557(+)
MNCALLTDDLLLSVLRFVDLKTTLSALSVCSSRFRSLCEDPRAYHTIAFEDRLSLTDQHMAQLAPKLRHIEKLSLSFCRALTDLALQALSTSCCRLKTLTLRGCEKITDDGLSALISVCPSIEELCLDQSRNLTDVSCTVISQHLPKLQSISLTWCKRITSQGIVQLCSGCPLLEDLNLDLCGLLDDAALCAMADHLPSLTSLSLRHLSHISDTGVSRLSQGCPKLRSLNLQRCTRISDQSVEILARNCRELSMLSLKGLRATIQDHSLLCLSQLPQLRNLCLSSCTTISDTGVSHLLGPASLLRLRALDLSGCRRLTELAFSACSNSRALSQLEELDVTNCTRLTVSVAQAVEKIAPACPQLRKICLQRLDDVAMSHLAAHCPLLQAIYVGNGLNCSDAGLLALGAACPKLRYLHLFSHTISEHAARQMLAICPDLYQGDLLLGHSATPKQGAPRIDIESLTGQARPQPRLNQWDGEPEIKEDDDVDSEM